MSWWKGKHKLVLFKSLGYCKRRKKGNIMLKSTSNKIMLCGVGSQQYLFFTRFKRNNFIYLKDLKRFTFNVNKKNIESLDLTRKVNLLRL